ncbi:MAG: site-specific integrase [Gammaproteobacteria bacterium]|nr:site-specific integrase [Acidobacteriota bacterium]MYF29690.1 site-specific integrase [Gammaproteobacteria bacterium]
METAMKPIKRPTMLSATFVKTVNVPGRYGDGRGGLGLSLLVRPGSRSHLAKCWTQSVRIGGKPTSLGLGRYPVVTLALARQRALENAQSIAEGRDPRRRSGRGAPTFADAVEKVMAIHAGNWKPGGRTEESWRATLRDYVLPRLGDMPVDAITGSDVMAVLQPIWTAKRETAKRVRARIGAVMKWAVAQGHRADNPAGDTLAAALPNNAVRRVHHKALPHAEVAAALRKVRGSNAYRGAALAFELLVLTATRSGEVRSAVWDDVDLESAVWTIPAERMKAGLAHRVPLSDQALALLDEARRELSHGGGTVFPSPTGCVQRNRALVTLVHQLGIRAVPHGFRSSFRDWAAECTDTPREVCELALAHVNRDRVEAAYRRSDLFERRRTLMQDWADYLAAPA